MCTEVASNRSYCTGHVGPQGIQNHFQRSWTLCHHAQCHPSTPSATKVMAVPMACRKGHPLHSSAIRKHTSISAPCLESNPTFPLNAPWCQGNNQKSQLHPQSQLLPDLSSICRAKNSPTRPGREGITAITSSTCQKHAELPELSGRHVDRPKPKKLADSNAAFVWTLYTCAVVDSRSPKGWHNHLVKLRARSPLPHRRWWFLKRR